MNRLSVIVVLLLTTVGATLLALNQANHAVILTTDSIVYVDTARHIADGQGVATSILTLDAKQLPNPQTQYPPLYPMVMSPFIRFGVEPILAGRLVSAISFGLTVMLLGLWAWRLAGPLAGLAAAALVTTLPAMTSVAAAVWADSLYTLLVTGLAWLGWELTQKPAGRLRWFVLGALAGLGLLDKYLGILLLGVVAVTVLLTLRHGPARWLAIQRLGLALAGVALFAVPLLLRNVMLNRAIGGADRGPSSQPLLDIIGDALVTVSGDFTATVLWIATLIVVVITLGISLRNAESRRPLAALWPIIITFVVYLVGLIAARFLIDTDRIHTRFTMPVYPLVVLLYVIVIAWAAKTFNQRASSIVLAALAIVSIAWSVKTYDFTSPAYTPKPSSRTMLIAQLTTERDLIIGDRAREYNLFLGRAVIQLSDDQTEPKLTPERLAELHNRWSGRFNRTVLAFSPNLDSKEYGPLAAQLSSGAPLEGLNLVRAERPLFVYQYQASP